MRISKHGTQSAVVALLALGVAHCSSGGGGQTGPPTPTAITQVSGNSQTGPAGQALVQPLVVKVTTASGAGVAGTAVTFAVTAGGGSVSATAASTNAQGQASVVWTLGPEPGSQTASATAQGLAGSPVGFSATATPNSIISGTIALANGFLSPPRRTPVGSDGLALALPLQTKAARSPGVSRQAVQRGSIAPASPSYTPDELIVTFRPEPLSAPPLGSRAMASAATARALAARMRSQMSALASSAGFEVTGASPAILSARVRVTDSTRLNTLAALLRNDPTVAAVERNAIVYSDDYGLGKKVATTLPNDPLYPKQAWHYGLIDLPAGWDITKGSASVLVAVVDQGIRFDHPALAANLTTDGYDFVSNLSVAACGGGTISNDGDGDAGYDADPTQPSNYGFDHVMNCAAPEAIGGHGVHVAGTIGAGGNDIVGVTGVNWTVKIRPVRVLGVTGQGTAYDLAQGILYAAGMPADNGAGGTVQASAAARIINLSVGSTDSSHADHLAIIAAANAGTLVVAGAGNSNGTTPLYPAAFPEALAVAAVGPSGTLASYSNYASSSGIAAPGGDQPVGDTSFAVFSTMWDFANNSATYQGVSGTSMATPHVSGVAALVLAQNPSLTAAQVRSRLTSYAVPVGPSNIYGAGIVNVRNSLTQTFGPSHHVYARLYSASTGAIVQTVLAAGSGSYSFAGLPDGGYYVFAGEDENGDQQIGVPDVGLVQRRWGAFGGTVTPQTVTVAGAGIYPASFSIGLPTETEPNNTTANAGGLVVGGYVFGSISSPSTDVDAYRVLISQGGQYTFQTSGWIGACGFALEEDTVLGLYDASGTLITSNDDIDAANLNLCSRITATLPPGTYYVVVGGFLGRRYRLQARSGS